MEQRIGQSAGLLAFAIGTLLAVLALQGMKMPTPVLYLAFVLIGVCIVIGLTVLTRSILDFCRERRDSLQFVDKWYCQYNRASEEVILHGNVDVSSSEIKSARAGIAVNDKTYWLKLQQPVHRHMLIRN